MNTPTTLPASSDTPAIALNEVIPLPVQVNPTGGQFTLTAGTSIKIEPASDEIKGIGAYLAEKLRPSTGYPLPVQPARGTPAAGNITLTTSGGDPALGEEGYDLTITPDLVKLVAFKPAGLFRGIQTIRQLLPPAVDKTTVQAGPWTLATGTIRDYPRFAWRGAMLDVSRHFATVDTLKRYIDWLAYYKMNIFHLHLTDDQGWRLMINSWPKLATYGGSTQVGGGSGGYYTQAEYSDIVAYAQSRYITVVPEIEMPSHSNAALASYPELNCSGTAPALYTGTQVGFSSFCANKEITYTFIDDVVREVAALTPGPYLHIGGDEALSTSQEDYLHFMERVESIVRAHGKTLVGWEEIARSKLQPGSIVQFWKDDALMQALPAGARSIMSPGSKAYMDMQYDPSTKLGLHWAGYVSVQDAYNWDPDTLIKGLPEGDILGVEAALWSETLLTPADIEFMTFPRLPGYAEIGWSAATGRRWEEYSKRLGAQGPRFAVMGVNFFRAPQVPWQ